MTTLEQRLSDRQQAVRYSEVENKLHLLTALLNDLAANATADRDTFYTFAEPIRNVFQSLFEQAAVKVAGMAEDAGDIAGSYREHLGVA